MPIVKSISELGVEWAEINTRKRPPLNTDTSRHKGVHLSGVIRHVAMGLGKLKTFSKVNVGRRVEEVEDDEEVIPIRMAMGLAWEEYVAGLMVDMEWQPGEMGKVAKGKSGKEQVVWMNCDGIKVVESKNGEELRICEFKLTWKSIRGKGTTGEEFLDQWMWLAQGQGYCLAATDQFQTNVNTVEYYIMWVNGDYMPPKPKFMKYVVQFGDGELGEFWRDVVEKNVESPGVKAE